MRRPPPWINIRAKIKSFGSKEDTTAKDARTYGDTYLIENGDAARGGLEGDLKRKVRRTGLDGINWSSVLSPLLTKSSLRNSCPYAALFSSLAWSQLSCGWLLRLRAVYDERSAFFDACKPGKCTHRGGRVVELKVLSEVGPGAARYVPIRYHTRRKKTAKSSVEGK